MEGEYSILEDEKSSILESNEEIQNEIESLKKRFIIEEESSDLKIKAENKNTEINVLSKKIEDISKKYNDFITLYQTNGEKLKQLQILWEEKLKKFSNGKGIHKSKDLVIRTSRKNYCSWRYSWLGSSLINALNEAKIAEISLLNHPINSKDKIRGVFRIP